MQTIVVGFGYKARQGKDFVVKTIIDNFSDKYDVRRYSFADALKREVNTAAAQCGGFPQLIEWLKREAGLPSWVELDTNPDMTDPLCPQGKHRKLLQWWGTEYRRSKDPYYWVKQLDATLKVEQPQVALISDMRFKNEFYWVKSFRENGWTVKVERIGYSADNNNEHASEKDLDGILFDDPQSITIQAKDGEIDHLRQCAIEAFEFIKQQYDVDEKELDFSVPISEDK